MARPLCLFFVLFCFLTTSLSAQGVMNRLAEIDPKLDDDFAQISAGLINHDYKVVYGFLYTPMMEQISKNGGVDKLIEATESREVKGVRIISYKSVSPFSYVIGKDRDYVVIPTLTRTSVRLGGASALSSPINMKSTGFILAVKVHGSTKWEYVYDYLMVKDKDAQLDPKREFFPDLPDNVLFPTVATMND